MPLNPVSSPLQVLSSAGVSTHQAGVYLFLVVLLFWGVFALISLYHWVRYSHAALVAIPAIGTYLVVSAILILFAVSGLS